jgi:hypothetical protein
MSIKIEREIMTDRNNYSNILPNSEVLYKSKVIINDSSSKAMYSFPLSERFKKPLADYSSFYYNIPSTLNTRKASIGFGSKSSILLSRRGKTDNYYTLPSSINGKSGSPKYTFGFSREICRKPKCLDERETPGPSNYFPYKKFGQSGLKYSMSFRYKYKKDPDNFPGPGTYEIPNTRILQGTKFSKTKRFNNYDWKYPGPGAYNFENLVKGNGVVYNSKYVSNNAKTFGVKLKWIKDKLITPGPGAYECFSEFEGFNRKNFVKIRKYKSNKKLYRNTSCSSKVTRATSALTRKTWISLYN